MAHERSFGSATANARRRWRVRDGFATEEFIDLARIEERTADQERRLDELKREMAERVMARPADVYEARAYPDGCRRTQDW